MGMALSSASTQQESAQLWYKRAASPSLYPKPRVMPTSIVIAALRRFGQQPSRPDPSGATGRTALTVIQCSQRAYRQEPGTLIRPNRASIVPNGPLRILFQR